MGPAQTPGVLPCQTEQRQGGQTAACLAGSPSATLNRLLVAGRLLRNQGRRSSTRRRSGHLLLVASGDPGRVVGGAADGLGWQGGAFTDLGVFCDGVSHAVDVLPRQQAGMCWVRWKRCLVKPTRACCTSHSAASCCAFCFLLLAELINGCQFSS